MEAESQTDDLPGGTAGVDSYGRKPVFTNRGEKRKKVICAIGRQDFDAETATPVDEGILILGCQFGSSHADVTGQREELQSGRYRGIAAGVFLRSPRFHFALCGKDIS